MFAESQMSGKRSENWLSRTRWLGIRIFVSCRIMMQTDTDELCTSMVQLHNRYSIIKRGQLFNIYVGINKHAAVA